MRGDKPTLDPQSWSQIEARPRFTGLQAIVEQSVIPKLAQAKPRLTEENPINALYGGGCVTAGMGLLLIIALTSIFKVIGFLIALVAIYFLARPAIQAIAERFVGRMIADLAFRQSVFDPIADHLGFKYVAAPGGGQGIVQQQSQEGLFQNSFKALLQAFERYGGQDEAVAAARASGLIELIHVFHIGGADEATKKARETGLTRLEDGFSGQHKELPFDAFEVVRSARRVQDGSTSPAEHALVLVLKLPRPLHGTTQLRSRSIDWHRPGDAERLEPVKLESNEFDEAFRVRANDQVEARFVFTPDVMMRMLDLAHGEPFRATAQGDHLVVAIEGPNRFDLTSPDTGLDGDAAVRLAVQQIGEMLDFVDAVDDAFRLDR